MQANNDHTNPDNLAQEGWLQMRELLLSHGLQDEKTDTVSTFNRRHGLLIAASLLLFVGISVFLYQVNRPHPHTDETLSSNPVVQPIPDGSPSIAAPAPGAASPALQALPTQKKNLHPTSLMAVTGVSGLPAQTIYLPSATLTHKVNEYIQNTAVQQEKNQSLRLASFQDEITPPSSSMSASEKSEAPRATRTRRPMFYAGAGANFSSVNNSSDRSLTRGITLHPSFRVQIPVSKNVHLHSGLNAFSSIHVKEAASIKKEEVNDLSADHLFTINKSTLIKAGYFEVPATVHMQLTPAWSVGAGVELKRLYQFNVKETEDEYDYSGHVTATSYDRNLVIGTLAAPAKKDKLTLAKWNTGVVLETTYKTGRILISGSYHRGLHPAVTIEEPNAPDRRFTNQYFKLGVQVQLNASE